MYFKVTRKADIFKQLKDVQAKMQQTNKLAGDLAHELGFKEWRIKTWSLAGGISAFHGNKKPVNWTFAFSAREKNDFYPKKIAANKLLIERIEKLPIVKFQELNKIIKYDGHKSTKFNSNGGQHVPFTPGISFGKHQILIEVRDYVEYKPVKGMTEITFTEYVKLSRLKDNATD